MEKQRNLVLPVSQIEDIISILKALDKSGRQVMKLAQREGIEIPEGVLRQSKRVRDAYVALREANTSIEVSELEALFALDYEQQG